MVAHVKDKTQLNAKTNIIEMICSLHVDVIQCTANKIENLKRWFNSDVKCQSG